MAEKPERNALKGYSPYQHNVLSQYILLGKQYGTIFKPFQLEADAASKLAIDLVNKKKPSFDKKDTYGVPFQALEPIVIKKADVQKLIDAKAVKYSDVCTGDVKAACDKAGIKDASS